MHSTALLNQPDISRFLEHRERQSISLRRFIWVLFTLCASETPMASLGRFSYQRLRNEGGFDDDDDYNKRRVIIRRAKSWSRFRRVSFRKTFKLKIPSLRRFMRRKARMVSLSWARILKRLKEGQSHFGDLFAGNYLFLQVTPTPMKCVEKSWKGPPHLHGYPLQRIA